MFFESLESRQLLAAGALDTTFGNSGFIAAPPVDGLRPLAQLVYAASPQGSVFVATHHSSAGTNFAAIHRYTGDGELDESYGEDGTVDLLDVDTPGTLIRLLADTAGRVYALLQFNEIMVVRLTPDGGLDTNWADDGIATIIPGFAAHDMVLLRDGSIAIVGMYNVDQSRSFEDPLAAFVKLRPNGDRDATIRANPRRVLGLRTMNLVPPEHPSDDMRWSQFSLARAAPDGSIVVLANFRAVGNNGSAAQRTVMLRLSSQGVVLDSNSDFTGTTIATVALQMEVDPFGRVLLVGQEQNRLYRLTKDLDIDIAFGQAGSIPSSFITEIAVQSDASILVGASFRVGLHQWPDHKPEGAMRRYRPNGAVDRAFGTNTWAYATDGMPFNEIQLAIDGSILGASCESTNQGIFDQKLSRFWRSDVPTGTIETPPITSERSSPQSILIHWRDDVEVDSATVSAGDLLVVSPTGTTFSTQFVGTSSRNNGAIVTGEYSLLPPGGRWDAADNGIWTVRVQPNQVADLDGNFVIGRSLGTFLVDT